MMFRSYNNTSEYVLKILCSYNNGSLKVQLTPKIFFRVYKSPCFSDRRCEKLIVVAILVNFL